MINRILTTSSYLVYSNTSPYTILFFLKSADLAKLCKQIVCLFSLCKKLRVREWWERIWVFERRILSLNCSRDEYLRKLALFCSVEFERSDGEDVNVFWSIALWACGFFSFYVRVCLYQFIFRLVCVRLKKLK